MVRRKGLRKASAFSDSTAGERQEVFPALDKIVMSQDRRELTLVYTHRPPVRISGDDPVSLLKYLETPTPLRYDEFVVAQTSSLEDTAIAA